MKRQRNWIVTALALAGAALLFAPGGARAGFIAGSLPGVSPNTVGYTLADTITSSALTLTGGPVTGFAASPTVWIQTPDQFWTASVAVVLVDTGFTGDLIVLSTTLQHTSVPHPAVDGGIGLAYADTLVANSVGKADGVYTVNGLTIGYPHGGHEDTFYNSVLTYTVAAGQITGWGYTLNGVHVPEPSSIALAGLGLAGLVAVRRRRRS